MKIAIRIIGFGFACNLFFVGHSLSIPLHEKFDAMVEELRVIGLGLQAYKADHDNQLPPRLTNLVSQGYLDADAFVSIGDPTQGSARSHFPETDEPGSSFFYEFSEAPCGWVPGNDSWAEIKYRQLYGQTPFDEGPLAGPFEYHSLPVVRNFWFGYPFIQNVGSERTVLNLAYDLETVYASHLYWEIEQKLTEPGDPIRLRGTGSRLQPPSILNSPLHCSAYDTPYEVEDPGKIEFPLWPQVIDLSGLSYRLLKPCGQGQIFGEIIGNIFYWKPHLYSPQNIDFTVELSRNMIPVATNTYSVIVSETRALDFYKAQITGDQFGFYIEAYSNYTYFVDVKDSMLDAWNTNFFSAQGGDHYFFPDLIPFADPTSNAPSRFYRLRVEYNDP